MAQLKKYFRYAFLLAGLAVVLTGANRVLATGHINFEYLDSGQNYQRLTTFPWGKPNEIVVASKEVDIRTLLPIQVSVGIVGGKKYTNTIPNNPTQYCRGADGCSIPGPVVADPGPGAKIIISAIDKNGAVIAQQRFGPDEKTSQEQTTPESQTQQTPSKTTPSESNGIDARLLWLGLLAILLIGGGGLFMATRSSACANECQLGACRSCELSEIQLATHGRKPGDESDLAAIGKHLIDLLGMAPLGAAGAGKAIAGGLSGSVIKEILEEGARVAADGVRGEIGVDIYVTLQLVQCENKTCWPWFWESHTTWVTNGKQVQVLPPNNSFKHNRGVGGTKDVGWSFHYLFSTDKEQRKIIGKEIRKAALKECGNCPKAKNI